MTKKIIGIVGGVGPYAGLDLNQKIFDNTITYGKDQDHLEVYLLTCANLIGDRTEYLLNPNLPNPAYGLFHVIQKLATIGAQVIGISCNSAHAPAIFKPLRTLIAQAQLPVQLLHIVEETRQYLTLDYPNVKQVGLLATCGTYLANSYPLVLANYQVILPDEVAQQRVHAAIYDKNYGIKAHSNPIQQQAIDELAIIAQELVIQGAQALIMGCTEIPLALKSEHFPVPLIDPTVVLARALIREAAPEQLL